MLKRLLVLVAVLAALFVFAPTASAQGLPLPTQCVGGTLTPECERALERLLDGGTVGDVLGNQGVLPPSCRGVLDLDPNDPLSTRQALRLLNCLTALTNLAEDRPEDFGIDEPAAGYAADYGYDLGYDIGYDEGIPEGGVDSGFGPTGSDDPGAPLAARGAALLVLLGVLGSGFLVMRRRHGS
ncbi:MAG: hypothetical protein M3217_06970 [Actinomycetota bacterium]|nr:hypothetical protein [Actinomycetota bacterium]